MLSRTCNDEYLPGGNSAWSQPGVRGLTGSPAAGRRHPEYMVLHEAI
ncbi:MAG: hypothetical protein QXE24_02450 [Desulfurococcaceae archaeon]